MDHPMHHGGHAADGSRPLNRTALLATLHCLAGCTIGEVAGMAIGTAWSWSNSATIVLATLLAFAAGYALSMIPLRRAGFGWARTLRVAFAAESLSIAVMELVDNAFMLLVPGAMDAPITSALFWGSLVASLVVAAIAAFPVNRWLIARGKGHAVVHAHH